MHAILAAAGDADGARCQGHAGDHHDAGHQRAAVQRLHDHARLLREPLGMTPAQLADPTRISPEEKAIFLQARRASTTAQDAVMQVIREGSLRGQKAMDIFFTTYRPQFDKADRDLYSGAITWGAYNTRLVEINRAFQGDLGQVS